MISVGLIGCGRIGLDQHLPALRRAEEIGLARPVGACDADRRRAEGHGVPAFGDVDELLRATRPDVVNVATHPSTHVEIVTKALAAGCHVLCEKPIAMDLDGARAMVDAAERAGKLLSICFEYRYWDEARHVRGLVARGELGHVHAVRTWGGAVYGFPEGPLFHRWATAGGGVLTHWTIHNVDLALWLLGNPEPLTATAFGSSRTGHEVEDFAQGFVRLTGGTVLTVEADWFQPPSSRPEGWELLGERGTASISPIRVQVERDGEWRDATPGGLAPCDYDMSRLIHGFLEAVRDGAPAPVSGREILRVQALMDALYASISTGREVAVANT